MSRQFLLLGTPRAGVLNYRFLCSAGAGLSDEEASAWIASAKERMEDGANSAVGPDFVGVMQRDVRQVGSARRGDEVLLLGGIDTSRADLPAIQNDLRRRLPELAPIALGVSPKSKGMVIDSPELAQWLRTDFHGVPLSRIRCVRRGPWLGIGRRHKVLLIGAVLFLGSILTGGALVWALRSPQASLPSPTRQEVVAAMKADEQSTGERLLLRLVGIGADSPTTAEVELRRVRGAGWRSRADELLAQLDGQAGIEPLSLMPEELRKKGVLHSDLRLAQERPAKEALQLRRYLHDWRFRLKDLRAAGQAGLGAIDAQKLGDFPTLALIKALTDDAYRSLDSEPPVPQLPWFSQQDEDTAKLLQELLQSKDGKRFLAQRAGAATQEPLTKVIPLLHQIKVIGEIGAVSTEFSRVSDLPQKGEIEIKEAIRNLTRFLRKNTPSEIQRMLLNPMG